MPFKVANNFSFSFSLLFHISHVFCTDFSVIKLNVDSINIDKNRKLVPHFDLFESITLKD